MYKRQDYKFDLHTDDEMEIVVGRIIQLIDIFIANYDKALSDNALSLIPAIIGNKDDVTPGSRFSQKKKKKLNNYVPKLPTNLSKIINDILDELVHRLYGKRDLKEILGEAQTITTDKRRYNFVIYVPVTSPADYQRMNGLQKTAWTRLVNIGCHALSNNVRVEFKTPDDTHSFLPSDCRRYIPSYVPKYDSYGFPYRHYIGFGHVDYRNY